MAVEGLQAGRVWIDPADAPMLRLRKAEKLANPHRVGFASPAQPLTRRQSMPQGGSCGIVCRLRTVSQSVGQLVDVRNLVCF
jgi:hypothetical protein